MLANYSALTKNMHSILTILTPEEFLTDLKLLVKLKIRENSSPIVFVSYVCLPLCSTINLSWL